MVASRAARLMSWPTVGVPTPSTRYLRRTPTRWCSFVAVTVAESGSEAVSLLREHPPGTFHLVLTVSMALPGASAPPCLPEADGSFPPIMFLLSSSSKSQQARFRCPGEVLSHSWL